MEIKLNEKQLEALSLAVRLKTAKSPKVGILKGPAGTGKSTSLRSILKEIGYSVLLAPTNRAARRAGDLSGIQAMTLHKFLYSTRKDPITGKLVFAERPLSDLTTTESKVYIVDEASMMSRKLFEDLWRAAQALGMSLLLIGDQFQLPPVTGPNEEDFSVFDNESIQSVLQGAVVEEVQLTEVHRQALDSPILRAATDIRLKPLDWNNAVNVIARKDFPQPRNIAARTAAFFSNGMDFSVIAFTNATRLRLNENVRASLGYDVTEDPILGERLLVRKNVYSLDVFNGDVVTYTGPRQLENEHPDNLIPRNGEWIKSSLNGQPCIYNKRSIITGQAVQEKEVVSWQKFIPYVEANFGYAMTCHAAQGSEFDIVVLYWEDALAKVMRPEMRIRWLYTAVTRAKKNLIIGGLH